MSCDKVEITRQIWKILSFHFIRAFNKHLFIICQCCLLCILPHIDPTLDTVYIWGLVRDLQQQEIRWTESGCILAGELSGKSDPLFVNHQQWRSFLPVLHSHVITGLRGTSSALTFIELTFSSYRCGVRNRT